MSDASLHVFMEHVIIIHTYRLTFRNGFLLQMFKIGFGVFEASPSALSLRTDLLQLRLLPLLSHQILPKKARYVFAVFLRVSEKNKVPLKKKKSQRVSESLQSRGVAHA